MRRRAAFSSRPSRVDTGPSGGDPPSFWLWRRPGPWPWRASRWAAASSAVPGLLVRPEQPRTGCSRSGRLSFHTHTTYTSRFHAGHPDTASSSTTTSSSTRTPSRSATRRTSRAQRPCSRRCRSAALPAGVAKDAWSWPATAGTSNGTALVQDVRHPRHPHLPCAARSTGQGSPGRAAAVHARYRTVDADSDLAARSPAN